MDDFTAHPGVPNAFGLIQSEHNAVAPGKKPLSSMTPTIVVRDGRATLAVGGAGGPRIISGTLQVLLNVTRFGMSPQEALCARGCTTSGSRIRCCWSRNWWPPAVRS